MQEDSCSLSFFWPECKMIMPGLIIQVKNEVIQEKSTVIQIKSPVIPENITHNDINNTER